MIVLRDETSTHFAYYTAENSCMSSEESECSFNYYLDNTLREKYPNTEFFCIFLISVFSSIISPSAGTYGPKNGPYLDTFGAVIFF